MVKNNTYTKIPNSFIESISALSAPAGIVYLVLARQTFGYHREDVACSYRFLSKATGLATSTVQNAIKELISKHFIIKVDSGEFLDKSMNTYKPLYR